MRVAIIGIAVFYALCGLASLGLLHASEHALFGMTPDPLAGLFSWLLALPWSLLTGLAGKLSIAATIFLLGAAMAVNLFLFLWLTRRWRND